MKASREIVKRMKQTGFVTAKEAAKLAGVNAITIIRAARNRKIRARYHGTGEIRRMVFVSVDDVCRVWPASVVP